MTWLPVGAANPPIDPVKATDIAPICICHACHLTGRAYWTVCDGCGCGACKAAKAMLTAHKSLHPGAMVLLSADDPKRHIDGNPAPTKDIFDVA